MKDYSNEKKNNATVRERVFKVNLSDNDLRNLLVKAGTVGLTVGDLLANFVRDLVYSDKSNGSDEERIANDYYDRCFRCNCYNDALLSYILSSYGFDDVRDFINTVDEIKELRESISDCKINPDEYENDIDTMQDDLSDELHIYNCMTSEYYENHPNIDIEQEIALCRSWLKKYDLLCFNAEDILR